VDATRDTVAVPEGTFAMGSNDGDEDERPIHRAHVAAFAIDRTEVTVGAYRGCVAGGACTAAGTGRYCNGAGKDEHPANCVSWDQARVYCAWKGGRLPSEAEWEFAARGADGRAYPWGNDAPRAQLCWDGDGSELGRGRRLGTCAVGAHPAGKSPFGAEDLAGNVWEWTADLYTESYTAAPGDALRVARGGTWFGFDAKDVRAAVRYRAIATTQSYGIGFRCVRSPDASKLR
jgi:formylglycine-generating enzyme required for sulfatase activity